MRRLDNYFPLPDPFHAALSKTAGLGTREFAPRARAHSRERGDRGALLSKLHLPVRIIVYAMRVERNGTKNLNRPAIIYLAVITTRPELPRSSQTRAEVAVIRYYVR